VSLENRGLQCRGASYSRLWGDDWHNNDGTSNDDKRRSRIRSLAIKPGGSTIVDNETKGARSSCSRSDWTGDDFSDRDISIVYDSCLVVGGRAGANSSSCFSLRATRDGNVNCLGLRGKSSGAVETIDTRLGACRNLANFNGRAAGERDVDRACRSLLKGDCVGGLRDGHEDGGDAWNAGIGVAIAEQD
jgi:hypothetical protein